MYRIDANGRLQYGNGFPGRICTSSCENSIEDGIFLSNAQGSGQGIASRGHVDILEQIVVNIIFGTFQGNLKYKAEEKHWGTYTSV